MIHKKIKNGIAFIDILMYIGITKTIKLNDWKTTWLKEQYL